MNKALELEEKVLPLIKERQKARKEKNQIRMDELRDQLIAAGVGMIEYPCGSVLYYDEKEGVTEKDKRWAAKEIKRRLAS